MRLCSYLHGCQSCVYECLTLVEQVCGYMNFFPHLYIANCYLFSSMPHPRFRALVHAQMTVLYVFVLCAHGCAHMCPECACGGVHVYAECTHECAVMDVLGVYLHT